MPSKPKSTTPSIVVTPPKSFNPNSPSPEYLIEEILPAHEIHLIFGPDGEQSRRDTFVHQMLSEWAMGQSVLGTWQSFPVPFCYMCYGRTPASLQRSLDKHQILTRFPTVFLTPTDAHDPNNIIRLASNAVPDLRLIVLDSISLLCPNSRDNANLTNSLLGLKAFCAANNVTIIGVASAPKAKANERYPNVRDRISGGGAWSQLAETMISVEAIDHRSCPNYAVTVSIGSTEEEEVFAFHWDPDRHRLIPGYILNQKPWRKVMNEWLEEFTPGDVFTTDEARTAAEERVEISDATLYVWLGEKTDEGRVMSQIKGRYLVRKRN